jgi:anti-anti-sigma regulatory factor
VNERHFRPNLSTKLPLVREGRGGCQRAAERVAHDSPAWLWDVKGRRQEVSGVRFDAAQLSVEVLGSRFRVVRVAGVLDDATVTRLAEVTEAQLERPGCVGHLVVDLGEVRSFATNDLDALVQACERGRRDGVRIHLAGLAARETLLPIGVMVALTQFSTFPTVEQAQRELVGRPSVPAVPRTRYGWPCQPSPHGEGVTARPGRAPRGGS